MGGRLFLIIGQGVSGIDFFFFSSLFFFLMTSILHHIPSFFHTLVLMVIPWGFALTYRIFSSYTYFMLWQQAILISG